VANKLNSDVFVEYLSGPTMADAAAVHKTTKKPVAFHSIAAYGEHDVPGAIDAYRRGAKKRIASSSGHIALLSHNVGPDGVEAAIRQHDMRRGGQPGGMMFMVPHPNRDREEELCRLVPVQMDIDGGGGDTHYRAPTATAMRIMAEHALDGSMRETKGRLKTAIMGRGRTTGAKLAEDLQKMGLDPLIITTDNLEDRRFLPECGIIFSAVGKEMITPDNVGPGAILIDAGVRVEDPNNPKETTFGDLNSAVYEMDDGIRYTSIYHGVGQLTTMIAVSNSTEAASRNSLLDITPRPLSYLVASQQSLAA
jgi:5,10-methylene-tetrahydrofolate dehydrogenase/methenyl tetrahydrofolate cyclohydrolase